MVAGYFRLNTPFHFVVFVHALPMIKRISQLFNTTFFCFLYCVIVCLCELRSSGKRYSMSTETFALHLDALLHVGYLRH